MQETTRAIRRAHYRRIKKQRIYHYQDDGQKNSISSQARYAATATVCSCPMCGNPRKYFKTRTRQEEIHELSFYEQLHEYLISED